MHKKASMMKSFITTWGDHPRTQSKNIDLNFDDS